MSAKNGTSTLATRSVRIQMAVIRWVPDSQKNRKQTKKTKKKQTNPRRNENPKPQSMGSFKITFLSTVYLRCWLWTYWTDALPGQEVVEQDEALLHTHQHDLLHGDGWQGQGLSKKKREKKIFISPPTGEYRKCNGGKWSRLPLQKAPTILHRHW